MNEPLLEFTLPLSFDETTCNSNINSQNVGSHFRTFRGQMPFIRQRRPMVAPLSRDRVMTVDALPGRTIRKDCGHQGDPWIQIADTPGRCRIALARRQFLRAATSVGPCLEPYRFDVMGSFIRDVEPSQHLR